MKGTWGVLENLDPRRHLGASIGWAVFAIIAVAAIICAWLVASATEDFVYQSTQGSLQQYADHYHHDVEASLESRHAAVALVAVQLAGMMDRPSDRRSALHALHSVHPEFSFIGLVDNQGVVIDAVDEESIGADVSQQSWLFNAMASPYVGAGANTNSELTISKSLRPASHGTKHGEEDYVALTAQVTVQNGDATALLTAQLPWSWIQEIEVPYSDHLDNAESVIQVIMALNDGTVVNGPDELLGQPIADAHKLSEQGKYLVGVASTSGDNPRDLDWTVAFRRDSSTLVSDALAPQESVFLIIGAAASLAAVFIVFAVSELTTKLRNLYSDAVSVANGESTHIRPARGMNEVSRIRTVLATSIENFENEKRTLNALNAELDQRVEDRTRVIERLSAESREVALTQQRLRFARDMHDTLSHTMMAVLTQIRVVRKIRHKASDSELEEELNRAEDAAKEGLTEARAAISQIRSNNVEDSGIGAALHKLVESFRARTGLKVNFRVDPKSVHQQGERSETVYRVVEEVLRNIEKHANASEVNITLDQLQSTVSGNTPVPAFRLDITDDGKGFIVSEVDSGHYGLIGLREQAALIGGELIIDSAPGVGTKLSLTYQAYA